MCREKEKESDICYISHGVFRENSRIAFESIIPLL